MLVAGGGIEHRSLLLGNIEHQRVALAARRRPASRHRPWRPERCRRSCISCWKSFWASWASRSSCFFLVSMAVALLCCSAGVSLSPAGLQLLGQVVDLVAQGLELLAAGIVLLLQVGEVALAFVGLGHGHLEGDDGDLGGARRCCGSGRSLGCGAQGKARGQREQ